MQAVEFQATVENGIVRIPKKYKDLQEKKEAIFVVMYNNNEEEKTNIEKIKNKMSAISIDTRDFKFDRNEAHER